MANALPLVMTTNALVKRDPQQGAIGYALAWLLGIPIPILLIVFLLRGCD